MAVTIKEIAEYANVSRGTVDRALHGRGGVKPEVERRIRAIAENMGYKPNSVAKALSNLKKKNDNRIIAAEREESLFCRFDPWSDGCQEGAGRLWG